MSKLKKEGRISILFSIEKSKIEVKHEQKNQKGRQFFKINS